MQPINCCSNLNNLWIVFLLQFVLTSTHSHLVANYFSVKFPGFSQHDRIWYDGQDDVYLFQDDSIISTSIFRYSLSTETINSLGSVSVSTEYGSIHSDSDGNIFYFGAGLHDDTILKYSPSTNSSSVVAQLPHDIYGIPTIKLDNSTVLILGKYRDDLEILSFDLLENKATLLENQLPVSIRYGSAIKFGKKKAYLFPTNGSMWELDLPTMTFRLISNITLPPFLFPSLMTDGIFILIMASFEPTSEFPDHQGLFQINPVTMTTEFLHVENWPTTDFLPAVYIRKMNGIFGLQYSSVRDDPVASEMFFIDLNPLPNPVIHQITTNEESTTHITLEKSLSTGSPLLAKFICSVYKGSESLVCSLPDNQTTVSSIVDVCHALRFSQEPTCNLVSPSIKYHDKGNAISIKTSSLGGDCSFHVDSFLYVTDESIECHLDNGITISLTFFKGEHETASTQYFVFVLLLILGVVAILLTGWVVVNYGNKKKAQINHVVLWDADKDCEIME